MHGLVPQRQGNELRGHSRLLKVNAKACLKMFSSRPWHLLSRISLSLELVFLHTLDLGRCREVGRFGGGGIWWV